MDPRYPRTPKAPAIDLPFWARLVMAALKVIPGIPQWILVILPIIIALLENLPLEQKRVAERELYEAGLKARDGNPKELEKVVKKYWLRHTGQIISTDLGTSGVKVDPLPGQEK